MVRFNHIVLFFGMESVLGGKKGPKLARVKLLDNGFCVGEVGIHGGGIGQKSQSFSLNGIQRVILQIFKAGFNHEIVSP